VLCAAGAGLALYAATRVWLVEVISRPAPLPALRETHTGGELLPWLPPLALVGLAGTGAVLATLGVTRRLVGLLLSLIGLALAAGGGYGATLLDGESHLLWPVLCALGGLVAAGGGALTALRSRDWPSLGARYERRVPRPVRDERTEAVAVWDALDRGEDPTEEVSPR
jgi:hypothetical protein